MCNRKTVFAEIPAGISGRKNCNVAIFALAGQALLRKNHVLGAAKPPLRIRIEGVAIPPNYPGTFCTCATAPNRKIDRRQIDFMRTEKVSLENAERISGSQTQFHREKARRRA